MDEIRYGKKGKPKEDRGNVSLKGSLKFPLSPAVSQLAGSGGSVGPGSTTSSMIAERLQELADSHQYEPEYEVERISEEIDKHTVNMKRSIMADILSMKRKMAERHRKDSEKSLEDNLKEVYLREEANQYLKQKIVRMKNENRREHVQVNRLATVYAAQTQKLKAYLNQRKAFGFWLSFYKDKVAEKKQTKLAKRHSKKKLLRNCFVAWRNETRTEKRAQVDLFWREKLETLSLKLVQEYEKECEKLRSQVLSMKHEVSRKTMDKENYEEDMKKAFMRGVCALNLEAMSMFKPPDGISETLPHDETSDAMETMNIAQANSRQTLTKPSLRHPSQLPDEYPNPRSTLPKMTRFS